MRNNNKKQKRGILFSAALVITGCLISAIYVDRTMNKADDYKVDLSELNTADDLLQNGQNSNNISGDPELAEGAELARTNGANVVNETPSLPTTLDGQTTALLESQKYELNSETDTTEDDTSDTEKQSAENKEDTDGNTEEKKDDTAPSSSKSVVGVQKADLSFNAEDGMSWPAMGDVILNYCMDSTVYFQTLEQYKYNPAILISANSGDNVCACAKGQVTEIGESAEIGNYVIMNIGSGYEITYGQLENLQVKKGSVVARGQVIGSVAQTTKYYTVEGNHVYLKITKDGEPVNPLGLLE